MGRRLSSGRVAIRTVSGDWAGGPLVWPLRHHVRLTSHLVPESPSDVAVLALEQGGSGVSCVACEVVLAISSALINFSTRQSQHPLRVIIQHRARPLPRPRPCHFLGLGAPCPVAALFLSDPPGARSPLLSVPRRRVLSRSSQRRSAAPSRRALKGWLFVN